MVRPQINHSTLNDLIQCSRNKGEKNWMKQFPGVYHDESITVLSASFNSRHTAITNQL